MNHSKSDGVFLLRIILTRDGRCAVLQQLFGDSGGVWKRRGAASIRRIKRSFITMGSSTYRAKYANYLLRK